LVGRPAAVVAQLHAHVTIAGRQNRFGVVEHFGNRGAVGVRVRRDRFAALAAEQHVQRQSSALAQDVPQRLVDARERVVQHRAVAPVAVGARGLPNVLDARDVASDHERRQVPVQHGLHREGALCECGATQPEKPRLGGLDFHDQQALAGRLHDEGPELGDGDRGGHRGWMMA
jgi:hypothetical protein